ncbi:glutathione S-transferase family protein [Albimonas sp. CAU 1670]|uniref:glutathione S-transferase family protein n=1 Tax=Albimonas sp. CAU 1670 TaxID=3032599 RepID=UPI0023DA8F5E|nr:glutathione S-transferase family protein [Albimonas sp. CAU 1670]MDF2231842.1 glutathione S-transferase family protein [Albimonas sp. CAU 1670]
MATIKVHGRATSSNVQTVMWCAAELGLEVERTDVGGAWGGTDTPEYRAMNPNGTIPAVEIDGVPLFESAAIVRCLAAMHGDEAFWPRDPLARATLDKWAEWAKVTYQPVFLYQVFVPLVRQTAEQRDPAALEKGVAATARVLGMLDAHLATSPWIGEAFSFADVIAGHLLYRLHRLEETGELTMPPHPNVSRYYADLTARPAFAEHVMISFDNQRPGGSGR